MMPPDPNIDAGLMMTMMMIIIIIRTCMSPGKE
jgi:hypothetical protein